MLVVKAAQLASMERGIACRLANSVVEDLRASSPHAVNGLSAAELDARLETAIGKAARYRLTTSDDFQAFVRLSLIIGPNFDEYPRFHQILTSGTGQSAIRISELFCVATDDDWYKAAQLDILGRYREPVPPVAPPAPPGAGNAASLVPLDATHWEPYLQHALHPDVWRLGRMKPLTSLEEVPAMMLANERAGIAGHTVLGPRQEFVGAIFVAATDTERRISYWTARPFWGRGIATAALRALTNTLRREPAPIRLRVNSGNLPSIKVAGKCGYKQVGDTSGGSLVFEA